MDFEKLASQAGGQAQQVRMLEERERRQIERMREYILTDGRAFYDFFMNWDFKDEKFPFYTCKDADMLDIYPADNTRRHKGKKPLPYEFYIRRAYCKLYRSWSNKATFPEYDKFRALVMDALNNVDPLEALEKHGMDIRSFLRIINGNTRREYLWISHSPESRQIASVIDYYSSAMYKAVHQTMETKHRNKKSTEERLEMARKVLKFAEKTEASLSIIGLMLSGVPYYAQYWGKILREDGNDEDRATLKRVAEHVNKKWRQHRSISINFVATRRRLEAQWKDELQALKKDFEEYKDNVLNVESTFSYPSEDDDEKDIELREDRIKYKIAGRQLDKNQAEKTTKEPTTIQNIPIKPRHL
ncbi:MAG: hypothetical protein LBL34_06145 [Clostridiales bacterium]|jgi:hypothetical protein|nr:hypothetical protein [Clostridiales bacterium]